MTIFKIAVVAGPPNSATNKVMRDMLPYWKEQFDTTLLGPDPQEWPSLTLNEFDLVHFGWIGYATLHQQFTEALITANVWQVGELYKQYRSWLDTVQFSRIVVDDKFTVMQLGQLNYLRTTEIPLTCDLQNSRLPYPKEITLGYFGNDYPSKRFSVVDAAGDSLGIPVSGFSLRKERPVYALDIEDVYSSMSIFVHSSFHDTNSLTAMEAMSYGRPVIATYSPGLARTLRSGYNGCWFDGSIEDLMVKVEALKKDFNFHSYSAMETVFPSVGICARRYARMFNEVLDSA